MMIFRSGNWFNCKAGDIPALCFSTFVIIAGTSRNLDQQPHEIVNLLTNELLLRARTLEGMLTAERRIFTQ